MSLFSSANRSAAKLASAKVNPPSLIKVFRSNLLGSLTGFAKNINTVRTPVVFSSIVLFPFELCPPSGGRWVDYFRAKIAALILS